MKYYVGVDIGSTTTKCIFLDYHKNIKVFKIVPTGKDLNYAYKQVLDYCLYSLNADESDVKELITTGYGRYICSSNNYVLPEIQAIAKGVNYLKNGHDEELKLVLDIGGQDCKALIVNNKGDVVKFMTNEKCASGTGKFIECIAKIYGYSLHQMIELALQSKNPIKLESYCGIFIDSEINRLLSTGVLLEDIFAALFQNIIKRALNLINILDFPSQKLYFTGGLAQNKYISKKLMEYYPVVTVYDNAQLICALGASCHAYTQSNKIVVS